MVMLSLQRKAILAFMVVFLSLLSCENIDSQSDETEIVGTWFWKNPFMTTALANVSVSDTSLCSTFVSVRENDLLEFKRDTFTRLIQSDTCRWTRCLYPFTGLVTVSGCPATSTLIQGRWVNDRDSLYLYTNEDTLTFKAVLEENNLVLRNSEWSRCYEKQ